MTFINNFKVAFQNSTDKHHVDSAALLVSHIILIAGFAIMSLLAINWLSTAVLNKAANDGKCLEESNSYSKSTMIADACKGNTQDSFTMGSDYIGRDMQD